MNFYFVGPLTDAFKEVVDRFFEDNKQLRDKVIFTGSIIDRQKLYSLYAKSRIICMISRCESVCIATVEGMYFDCIPIITNYGSIVYEQTDNERFGAVVENSNVDDLVKKLGHYMSDNNLLTSLEDSCRQYARQNYDYQNIAKMLDGYLKKLY